MPHHLTVTTAEQAREYIENFKHTHKATYMDWQNILQEASTFTNNEVFKAFLDASKTPVRDIFDGDRSCYANKPYTDYMNCLNNFNHYGAVIDELSYYSKRTKMAELFVEKYPDFLNDLAVQAADYGSYTTMGALIKKGADANSCAIAIVDSTKINISNKVQALNSLFTYTPADIYEVTSKVMSYTLILPRLIQFNSKELHECDSHTNSKVGLESCIRDYEDRLKKTHLDYTNNLKILDHLFQNINLEQLEIKMQGESSLINRALTYNNHSCELTVLLLNHKAAVDEHSLELAESNGNHDISRLVKNAFIGIYSDNNSMESICPHHNTDGHTVEIGQDLVSQYHH